MSHSSLSLGLARHLAALRAAPHASQQRYVFVSGFSLCGELSLRFHTEVLLNRQLADVLSDGASNQRVCKKCESWTDQSLRNFKKSNIRLCMC